jgi:hypothetical protein
MLHSTDLVSDRHMLFLMRLPPTVQPTPPEPTSHDFLPSLLRDTTGSHLLQTILLHAPEVILSAIWKTYFVGKVGKLASHPIGNYVVSSGIKRLEGEKLRAVMLELEAVGVSNLIREFRLVLDSQRYRMLTGG